ncbi:Glyoxalase/bleomycin resistance protein/dioxygenase OS=Tsukamurella paurometabola (strain ATCC 8368/ DSM / CCUG 35730 / CIP 100753 / JCM 10117 / KCTC 9821/ NBRC 16120 / NCIMB 702349 / NCTC 13040) OX=521096 GN=Tpau_3250 PE=4 SV=1 [Tsukamurella paurometabola]|uniref:Glyoxalase/bleomycin resistance protein/dioxygenase n=1 Tax=Tsukamurella paurometabola (strain ATCC 8368 / DSM 20162 / CCUG 35730 / CIP 100753 / JCM 10117 / KCTC 9821 / NBRC 16120 / NCIMB 702349 / NCTC 13040) TaxID=521096 RepID=D5UVQ3_TSUPD|nr:VOC family protein [Tsukamurella paurometabola]ADG79835.1 Glyoxalase/bleomycin resistance protein/dioxygenase [Tsukamurella paurometabola DSM 20162]SUP37377.1 Predicted lactoylglutathione lyase [Tsukamurella paurometabola]
MHKMIFVNLPVADVQRSRDFFTAVGYTINENFSDENALAVELGENIAAMLLTTEFFGTFHEATTAVPGHKEVLVALSAESREEVDAVVNRAVAAGGKEGRSEDHGFMYGRSFDDPDGHGWEIMWMDPAAAEAGPEHVAAQG